MPFTKDAFSFLSGLKKHNNKTWFEAHRESYENDVREPMRELIGEIDARFRKFAPEMGGDPKRSMFRINRDIRFSKDKSPYKTHAACWFHHSRASRNVGQEANEGSGGFYFHLEPGECFVGAGLWMPPSPSLKKLRDAIDDDLPAFLRVVKSLKRFGGLDTEHTLKRIPRGYEETNPAAKWLKLQSFTSGRALTNAQALSPKLGALLQSEFTALLPLVRWINKSLGLPVGS